jgi:protein-S-isoprenylcysteine O-methyltransferase Ste14
MDAIAVPRRGIMLMRALLAFLALPGVVAIAVPILWLMTSSHTQLIQPLGLVPLVIGFLGLIWCVRDFYVAGKGTLAPWAPPVRVVVVGLYRYTRNPMYVAVTLVLLGWAATFWSRGLFIYCVCVAIAFHLRVVLGEEPWLARTHGEEWERYAKRVPRWFW